MSGTFAVINMGRTFPSFTGYFRFLIFVTGASWLYNDALRTWNVGLKLSSSHRHLVIETL